MATIKDVASLAGVSTATVSRVINQTAWVEPVTRERVEKAMRDLNYRRNAAAIALAKRSGDKAASGPRINLLIAGFPLRQRSRLTM